MSYRKVIRRDVLRSILAAGTSAFFPKRADAKITRQPNMILFLSDDQKWDVVGYEGHPLALTPNIDALASRGVAFRNSFVTTPICASSRATLFSGTYYAKHKFNFGTERLANEFWPTLFPNLLKTAGYKTALVGKLGVWFEDGIWGAIGRKLGWSTEDSGLFDVFEPVTRIPYISEDEDGVNRHSLDKIERHSREFLAAIDKDQPFCLIVAFNEPHITPAMNGQGRYEPAETEAALFPDAKVPISRLADPAITEALPDILKQPILMGSQAVKWLGGDPTNEFVDYFRLVAGVDRVVGNILDELQATGLEDNTIVVFTSDNGLSLGDRGLSGKWTHFEESVRVPLIIYDPRNAIAAGTRPVEFALNVDLAPTILEYAYVTVPEGYQGRSLVPFIQGQHPDDWRTEFYCEHEVELGRNIPDWIGLRSMDFVFAEYFSDGKSIYILTDEKSDSDEIINLAGDPGYASVFEAYRERAHAYQKKYSK